MTNSTKRILSTIILLTVISFALKAQTNVSGGIYSNTTWTKANSPYIVTDTVVVFPGVTLTIEAGVTVKFADHVRLELRGAKFIAVGSTIDSITFTSNSLTPTPGIWPGIYLNNYTDTIKFDYCNFLFGNVTIQLGYYSTIKNSSFSNNLSGVEGGGSVIDSCNFNHNTNGLTLTSGSINHSSFSNNQTAIFGLANSSLKNCTISDNQTGVKLYQFQTTGYVENCIVDSNHVGIEVESTSDGRTVIKGCTINYNDSAGFIGGDEESGGDSIVNCQIKYNGYGIEAASYTICNKNDIENNNVGVTESYMSYPSYFSCNKICNNTIFNFENTGSYVLHIPNNYWCLTDSATIDALIYDGYDNINLGIVYFLPIDTIGCYLTGCNLHLTTNVTNATCDTCHNGNATVNIANGHPNYTYTWYTSPIQYNQTATGLASGTYNVCVSDGNGCTACTSVFVDSSNCTGFAINANGTNTTCITCTDGFAWVNVSNGTAPYTYSWYTSPLQNTDTAINLLHGTYVVCVTDLYGCAACDSVTIGTGSCSAHFDLYPDTLALHQYIAVNRASGAGTLSYDWNWGDGSAHDTTPYPSHSYATAGFYTICLTITDSAGCTNTYCNSFYLMRTSNSMIHVNVIPPIPTGINESSANSSFSIFPNPTSEHLTLFMPGNISKANIKIFNLLGEVISSSTITKQTTDIDVSLLAKGLYILEVSFGDTIQRRKFIKE